MRQFVIGVAVTVAAVVVGASSIAWATGDASPTGTAVCLPKHGALLAVGPDGECPKGSAKVTVANLDGVQALDARVASLEAADEDDGAASGVAGATEAHVAVQNWFAASCGDGAWVFVNCGADPAQSQYGGPESTPPVTDYGMTLDGSRYPDATTWTMDMRFLTRGETCVRLFDVTANQVVNGSEYCATGTDAVPTKGRTFGPAFVLPAASRQYVIQSRNTSLCPYSWWCYSSGTITVRELVARW